MGTFQRLEFQSNVLWKFVASKNIQSDVNYIFKNTYLQRAARALTDEPEESASE